MNMTFDLDTYFNNQIEGETVLFFKGSITSVKINELLEYLESKLREDERGNKIRKKVYNVLVEALQNLYHHLDEAPSGLVEGEAFRKFGMVAVSRNEEDYFVTTGNFIKVPKDKVLTDKISKINSLELEELKDLYKFILNHQKLSEKGGGGLGLIDIARKTGNKLDFNIAEINELYSFFSLRIKINN